MSERLSGPQFLASPGVLDWRAIFGGGWATAFFRVGSLRDGVALVDAIGELAGDTDAHVDVDLRHDGVTVRLSCANEGLDESLVELARGISEAAARLGLAADPGAVQHVQLAIETTDVEAMRPFWRELLGYDEVGDADLFDPRRRGPTIWFQQDEAPEDHRRRFHVDVYVPHDQAEARIAAALAAGGRMANDAFAPEWWTLADPEGNLADVAIWME